MSTEQGVARALVSIHGLTLSEASDLVERHRGLIVDCTIQYNAERIIEAEASSLPSPTVEIIDPTGPPGPEAPQTKSKSKAQQNLKPFIRLGGTLVPLNSDKEVKQMQREGFEIVMQAETEG